MGGSNWAFQEGQVLIGGQGLTSSAMGHTSVTLMAGGNRLNRWCAGAISLKSLFTLFPPWVGFCRTQM